MMKFICKPFDENNYSAVEYTGGNSRRIVVVPGGSPRITVLYDYLFRDHTEIEEVRLPDTITNIGSYVFDGCTSLKTVNLPDSLTDMWNYAFSRSGIETIDIPGSVSAIMPHVFRDCKKLREVICHGGTRQICACAFQGCTSLQTITVPPDAEIDPEAFLECPEDLEIVRRFV